MKFHQNDKGGGLHDPLVDLERQQQKWEVCHRTVLGLVKHLKNMTTIPSLLLSLDDNDDDDDDALVGVYGSEILPMKSDQYRNDYNTIMTTFGIDYAQCELLLSSTTTTTTGTITTNNLFPFDVESLFEQCHCKHNVMKNIMEQIYELELRMNNQQEHQYEQVTTRTGVMDKNDNEMKTKQKYDNNDYQKKEQQQQQKQSQQQFQQKLRILQQQKQQQKQNSTTSTTLLLSTTTKEKTVDNTTNNKPPSFQPTTINVQPFNKNNKTTTTTNNNKLPSFRPNNNTVITATDWNGNGTAATGGRINSNMSLINDTNNFTMSTDWNGNGTVTGGRFNSNMSLIDDIMIMNGSSSKNRTINSSSSSSQNGNTNNNNQLGFMIACVIVFMVSFFFGWILLSLAHQIYKKYQLFNGCQKKRKQNNNDNENNHHSRLDHDDDATTDGGVVVVGSNTSCRGKFLFWFTRKTKRKDDTSSSPTGIRRKIQTNYSNQTFLVHSFDSSTHTSDHYKTRPPTKTTTKQSEEIIMSHHDTVENNLEQIASVPATSDFYSNDNNSQNHDNNNNNNNNINNRDQEVASNRVMIDSIENGKQQESTGSGDEEENVPQTNLLIEDGDIDVDPNTMVTWYPTTKQQQQRRTSFTTSTSNPMMPPFWNSGGKKENLIVDTTTAVVVGNNTSHLESNNIVIDDVDVEHGTNTFSSSGDSGSSSNQPPSHFHNNNNSNKDGGKAPVVVVVEESKDSIPASLIKRVKKMNDLWDRGLQLALGGSTNKQSSTGVKTKNNNNNQNDEENHVNQHPIKYEIGRFRQQRQYLSALASNHKNRDSTNAVGGVVVTTGNDDDNDHRGLLNLESPLSVVPHVDEYYYNEKIHKQIEEAVPYDIREKVETMHTSWDTNLRNILITPQNREGTNDVTTTTAAAFIETNMPSLRIVDVEDDDDNISIADSDQIIL